MGPMVPLLCPAPDPGLTALLVFHREDCWPAARGLAAELCAHHAAVAVADLVAAAQTGSVSDPLTQIRWGFHVGRYSVPGHLSVGHAGWPWDPELGGVDEGLIEKTGLDRVVIAQP